MGRPFAFVCFDTAAAANKCLELNGTDPFGFGEPLYVSWAMKTVERKKVLSK